MEIEALGCQAGEAGVVLVAAKRHAENGTGTMVPFEPATALRRTAAAGASTPI